MKQEYLQQRLDNLQQECIARENRLNPTFRQTLPEGHVAHIPQPVHVEFDRPPPKYRARRKTYAEDYAYSSPNAFRRHYYDAQREGL